MYKVIKRPSSSSFLFGFSTTLTNVILNKDVVPCVLHTCELLADKYGITPFISFRTKSKVKL